MIIARERLYLTADKQHLVREGDSRAATLYAAAGHIIPAAAAELFGIASDGVLVAAEAEQGKEKQPARDKEKAPRENKGTDEPHGAIEPPAPPEIRLADIEGIGPATVRALAAAGITEVHQLSVLDPSAAPALEGYRGAPDWAAWIAAAKAACPPGAPAPAQPRG